MERPSDAGVALPQDVVQEILLRVPARHLCRFRAVCRSWSYLLADPSFIKEYAVLHPGFILALAADGHRIDVSGFSGDVVQQIQVPAVEESVMPVHPGPLYLFRANSSDRIRVIDPDRGTVSVLPFDDPDKLSLEVRSMRNPTIRADYTIGLDVSTGHRKVLRVMTHADFESAEQLCHVLTLRGSNYNQQSWRPRPRPPSLIKSVNMVTVQGAVYFLVTDFSTVDMVIDVAVNSVVSFDLGEEEWRPAIQGPPAIDTAVYTCRLKLAKLNNSLAMVHYDSKLPDVDLWLAEDLMKGHWVKKHSVHMPYLRVYPGDTCIKHLMELDNGRIVLTYYVFEILAPNVQRRWTIYDPRTKECTHVPQLAGRTMIGVYSESRLFLQGE